MKKAEIIAKANTLIAEHNLDFDLVPEDSKIKVDELKDLLADLEEAVAEATAPPTVTVAEIARELDKDPKTVRARLRRLEKAEDNSIPPTIEGAKQRWTWNEEHREAVTALVANEG